MAQFSKTENFIIVDMMKSNAELLLEKSNGADVCTRKKKVSDDWESQFALLHTDIMSFSVGMR